MMHFQYCICLTLIKCVSFSLPFRISAGLCLWPGWGMELGWVSLLINYVYTHYHMLASSEMTSPEESSTMLQVLFKVRWGLFLALGLNLDGLDHLPRSLWLFTRLTKKHKHNYQYGQMQTQNQFDLSHAPVHIQGHVESSPYFYSAQYCNKNNAYTTIKNFRVC